jgi:hypothetical protein
MTWIDDLDPRQQKELDFARTYASKYAHGTDGHHRLMLIAELARRLDAMERELRLHAPAPADLGALDTRILMDIADWAARHGLTLSDAALTDALQQVRNVHYQRLNAEEQLVAAGIDPSTAC